MHWIGGKRSAVSRQLSTKNKEMSTLGALTRVRKWAKSSVFSCLPDY